VARYVPLKRDGGFIMSRLEAMEDTAAGNLIVCYVAAGSRTAVVETHPRPMTEEVADDTMLATSLTNGSYFLEGMT